VGAHAPTHRNSLMVQFMDHLISRPLVFIKCLSRFILILSLRLARRHGTAYKALRNLDRVVPLSPRVTHSPSTASMTLELCSTREAERILEPSPHRLKMTRGTTPYPPQRGLTSPYLSLIDPYPLHPLRTGGLI